jgi:hypothetical protein
MWRRRALEDSDLWALRLPPRTGLSADELDVLHLVLLATDLHRLGIGLPPAAAAASLDLLDFDRRVERKRSGLGTFLGLARVMASAISRSGGVNSAPLHLA